MAEKELATAVIFTVVAKKKRHIVINLIKDVRNLYMENHSTVKEEIEEDTKKWQNYSLSNYVTDTGLISNL